jgi:hypothetical protein
MDYVLRIIYPIQLSRRVELIGWKIKRILGALKVVTIHAEIDSKVSPWVLRSAPMCQHLDRNPEDGNQNFHTKINTFWRIF